MCKGKCYAYEELKRQLQDQCTTYLKLHPNKEIGKGRYTYKGELVPNKEISEYLRGGIISTMAVFEEFLANIMAEAFDRIIYEHKCTCGCTCSVSEECKCACKVVRLKGLEALGKSKVCSHAFREALQCDAKPSPSSVAQKAHEMVFGQKEIEKTVEDTLVDHRTRLVSGTPLLHDFDEAFGKLLDPVEGKEKHRRRVVSDLIFAGHQPIKYLYLLDDESHSKIAIKNKETLCAILRLWYGIRCISAHGVAEKTIHRRGGALKDFPKCHTCDSCSKRPVDGIVMLEKSRELCNLLDEILGELNHETIQGEDYSSYPENYKTFLKVKRFPRIDVIQNIPVEPELEEKKAETIKLAEEHWLASSPGEYPPAFGFYHMYRTYYFISCLQRGMYITYRELVRINQFILLLAFRIKLAIAKWLSECDDSEVMPDLKGLWGCTDDEDDLKTSIQKVETEHEERIKEIKRESAIN